MPSNTFMFATGIENSYPTIMLPDGTTKRVDEMEKTLNWSVNSEYLICVTALLIIKPIQGQDATTGNLRISLLEK